MTDLLDGRAREGASRSGALGAPPNGDPAGNDRQDLLADVASDRTEGSDEPDQPEGPSGRRRLKVAGATAAGIGLVVVAVLVGRLTGSGSNTGGGDDNSSSAARQTTEVTVRDLVEQESLSGSLGYGETRQVARPSAVGGDDGSNPSADPGPSGEDPTDGDTGSDIESGADVVTALPAVGTVIERGGSVAEVDGKPLPLLYGDKPFWRDLALGVADGSDIRALEENLVALGYATSKNLTVDETFTSATAAAIERWQDALGRTETGTFDPSDAVVQPGPIRIAKHLASLGGSAGAPLVDATGAAKYVTLDLDADRQDFLAVGQEVEVVLPDGQRVTGVVESIGTVATVDSEGGLGGGGGDPTVPVTVTFADPAAVGGFDQAPVTVNVTLEAARGVLAVPVDVLLALAEGGYAVERVASEGLTELVAVEIGTFADGWVEVRGELAAGDDVVVAG